MTRVYKYFFSGTEGSKIRSKPFFPFLAVSCWFRGRRYTPWKREEGGGRRRREEGGGGRREGVIDGKGYLTKSLGEGEGEGGGQGMRRRGEEVKGGGGRRRVEG
jgi:hypothetical protein